MPEAHARMESVRAGARRALAGEQVRLRELREADLPELVAWWRDPDVAVFNSHVQPRPDKPLEEMFRSWSDNGSSAGVAFCVETLNEELVGHVSMWGADVRNRCATFGIVIGPEHQTRGFGTEATRLMISYGFTELGLHRIELMVHAENERAIAVYRRVGFEQEGLFRSKLFYGGCFHDQVLMATLSPVD
ncbi:GCN5-related N-acetyltransferase [Nostocoides japonicum T1-X7]|uniref:GCN5-related N-acetyltransferase n=1 Tax=Nostocoides japonicum T1-X7 TaxID=1194083 RepID=A0A077M1X1_9MICO|nr:GNAT family protein [Tetrasphaera japonica]CCH78214.1 GCN5-related N-acetyltransferase [Tetrasphaera japonica T1-X7]